MFNLRMLGLVRIGVFDLAGIRPDRRPDPCDYRHPDPSSPDTFRIKRGPRYAIHPSAIGKREDQACLISCHLDVWLKCCVNSPNVTILRGAYRNRIIYRKSSGSCVVLTRGMLETVDMLRRLSINPSSLSLRHGHAIGHIHNRATFGEQDRYWNHDLCVGFLSDPFPYAIAIPDMKRAVIITGHFPFQKRRGSVLWVSHHLQKMGWHVTHVTVGYSWLSYLKTDQRLKALDYKPKQGQQCHSVTLTAIFGFSPVHPARSGHHVADKLISAFQGLFKAYWRPRLKGPLVIADLVICESGAPVLLAPLLSKYAPLAARIYRVNDDIHLLNAPDFLQKAEVENAQHFTRISSANQGLTKQFRHRNITLDPMGVPIIQLDEMHPSPFSSVLNQKVAVCAGTTQLDQDALFWIAKSRSNWQVHVLGRTRGERSNRPPNLIYHGEVNFDDIVGFVQHADIGLAPYTDQVGIEYQTTNSNRMLLYRHFGLPILGPDRLCDPSLPSIIGYSDPNALDRCESMPKRPEAIQDWSELAIALTQNAEMVPPTDVA